MIDFPELRSGDSITQAVWDQARGFVLRNVLRAGDGILLTQFADGTIISAKRAPVDWSHPFRCGLRGDTKAAVATGWINGAFEPEIKQIPLSGNAKNDPPLLEWLTGPKLADDGTGFIAVEVTFGDKWEVLDKHGVNIVQVAYLDRDDGDKAPAPGAAGTVPILTGRRARWGLARLKRSDGGQLKLFQVVHGDLQCKAQPKSASSEIGRVFFW